MTCDSVRAYFAGLLDGEGYIGIRTVCRKNREWNYNTYALQIVITNSHKPVLEEAQRIWGGSLSTYLPHNREIPVSKLNFVSQKAAKFLLDVYPYLRIKREQAFTALDAQGFIDENGIKGKTKTNEQLAHLQSLQDKIRSLNQRKYNGTYIAPLPIGGGCLSCGCMLPANGHGDQRTITYTDYQKGDRNFKDAAAYNDGSVDEAKRYTQKTLAAIKSGKLSPTKK